MLDQNILSIDAPHEPRLDNFVVGDNAELIKALRQPVQGFCAIWIYGDLSSGKSHLLQGCYHEAQAGGGNCFSIDCSDCQGLDYYSLEQIFRPALDSSLNEGDAGVLVVVDDAHLLKSNRHGEELLIALYNHLMNIEGTLLISHNQSAMAENFDLADLNSRMRSLGHYQIMPLDDHGKARVLRLRAEERGYHLSETVLDYWLRRGPRKLQVLLQDLEKLDFATLQLKRTLTVPLLKEVLGY